MFEASQVTPDQWLDIIKVTGKVLTIIIPIIAISIGTVLKFKL